MKQLPSRTAALLVFLLAVPLQAAVLPVSIQFGESGLERVTWNDKNYLANGRIRVESAQALDEKGPSPIDPGKVLSYEVDIASQKVAVEYEAFKVVCSYATDGNRLDWFVEVSNKTTRPLADLKLILGEVILLKDYQNNSDGPSGWLGVNNVNRLGFRRLAAPDATIALGNWEMRPPVSLNIGWPTVPGSYPIVLQTPTKTCGTHPVVDARFFDQPGRPIAAGQSDRFHVSLSFSPPETKHEDLCPELLAHIRNQRPTVVKWPDRRAIGMLFLANPMTGWATNPRGYIIGKGKDEDVTTEKGMQDLSDALTHYAERSIRILKDMNAQGVIVWDLEGAEFYHPITYIGDPRKVGGVSPEMDRLADPFFKKFTDAGFKVGVTIRPTEIHEIPGQPGKWTHCEVQDPVQLISAKIAYAQKRWGCTIFYLDSNVFNADWLTPQQKEQLHNVPYLLPVAILEHLQRMHPDVLIIPEWSDASYYTCSAPYGSAHLRQYGTSRELRAIHPEAFSAVSTNRSLLEQAWETYREGVSGGDVLLFPA